MRRQLLLLCALAAVPQAEPMRSASRVAPRSAVQMVGRPLIGRPGEQRGRKDFDNTREWQKSSDRKWKSLEEEERAGIQFKRGETGPDGLTDRRRKRRDWFANGADKSRTRISTWRPRSGPGAEDTEPAPGDAEARDADLYGERPPERTDGAVMSPVTDGDGAWYDLAALAAASGETRTDFFADATFEKVGASEAAVRALRSLGIEKPSHVQALGYKRVLHGHNCLIADRTGSGKTLAYLTPLIQRIHEQETMRGITGEPGLPLALVLAPTAELATQVLQSARALARGGVPFRSAVITGDYPWRTQKDALKNGLELLVATPGRLASHLEAGTLQLRNVQTVVVDEIDVLLEDDDFAPVWAQMRANVSSSTNFVFVTATLPKPTEELLRAEFPGLKVEKGPGLHMAVPGVRHVLVECGGANAEVTLNERLAALDSALAQAQATRTLVFCNSIENCRAVENHLERRERRREAYRVLAYHAALSPQKRRAHLEEFVDLQSSRRENLVLVATDRASRGIDFSCSEHVILFDFPRRGDEWLRRVGRVGRGAQGGGLVTSLVLPYQAMRARKMLYKTLGQEKLWIG